MQWPWVSRARLADMELRVNQERSERIRLMNMLMGDQPAGGREPEIREAERPAPVVDDGIRPIVAEESQGTIEGFNTPFDRLNVRFELAKKSGIDKKFRARA